ncbi:MAG: hypothetical protein HC934_10560 [Acaryochloridaceae cyanobacterium SU_2_1]|nr:hypothetical protein [Acaryochloridaceae cyanobacterium SU_2_1]
MIDVQIELRKTARKRYVELAQAAHQDLGWQYLGSTYEDYYAIVSLYPDMGQTLDQGVLLEALIQGETPEQACALIAQSPYVQSQLNTHDQALSLMSAYGMPLINNYAQVFQAQEPPLANSLSRS